MNNNKNTSKRVPIALGIQVGMTVRGTEQLAHDRGVDTLWVEGEVLRVNNGIATVHVTRSENNICDGDTLFIFTHELTMIGR